MSSLFVVKHLLSPCCAPHSVLRPRHAEVNIVLSEQQPVQKGTQTKQGSQCSGVRAGGSQMRQLRVGTSTPVWGSRGGGLELNLEKCEGESQGMCQLEKHMQKAGG